MSSSNAPGNGDLPADGRLGEVAKSGRIAEGADEGQGSNVKRRNSGKGGRDNNWRKNSSRRKSTDNGTSSSQKHANKPNKDKDGHQASVDHISCSSNSAKDRRRVYGRANSHRNFSAEKQPLDRGNNNPRGGIARSLSINQQATNQNRDSAEDGGKRKITRASTGGKDGRLASNSMNSMNGESFDYDDDISVELDEPFSDSDDESPRAHQKPCLIIPRGRIRTLSGTVPPIGYSPKWGGPTMCLCCLQFFNLPDEIEKFAGHLLDEHRIVIEEVHLIVDPKRYVEHWRQRFARQSIEDIFPKVTPNDDDPLHGKVEYYFDMSERLPEDYSLRQRLAMRRLEEALACQQREREEVSFSMQCIFCRYVARGNRSKIIHHLYMIHHLNLGSPDNLVFVSEYIDHLKDKLQKNECIYCEKTFSDRNVLMDHMRKRNHREVNPKNNYYDKFYIINYLELGKRWLDVLAEDFEDTMPTFVDSDDEEEEESWHEWQEDNMDEDQIRAVCLFCDFNSEKTTEVLTHSKEVHSVDLLDIIEKEKLGFYERMKFFNFLRKQTFNTPNFRARASTDDEPIKAVTLPSREQWDTEENLVPMFGNDHLLWMVESYLEAKGESMLSKSEAVGAFGDSGSDLEHGVAGDWDVSKRFAELRRQASRTSVDDSSTNESAAALLVETVWKTFVELSKASTVEGVVAEDWPDLSTSVLADHELCKSLR